MNTSSLNQVGSTSYVSGLSGTNFSGIIKAEYQKDISLASLKQKYVTEQKQKLTRYKQLSELVNDVQKISKNLSAKTFTQKNVSQTNGTEKNVKVTLSDKAQIGRLSLKVLQLASAHKVASLKFGSATKALSQEGILHLKAGKSIGADVTITKTMTLNDVAKVINAKTSETGVSATIVKISETEHRLVLSGTKTNQPISLTDKNGGTLSHSLKLVDAKGKFLSELTTAKPAKIELNGLAIERDNNKISDAVAGVSLDLLKADTDLSINMDIESNRGTIKDEVKKFVEAFNKLRSFIVSQQATSSGGGAAPGAHLFGETILKNLMDTVYSELGRDVLEKGKRYSLRSLGLSFNNDNTLKIDDAKLNKVLDNNLDVVKSYFAGKAPNKGLGERLVSSLKTWNGSEGSIIDKERASIDKQISNYQSDITKIVEHAKSRRQNLIRYYAQLERQIASSKLLMQQLSAITKANNAQS